MEIAYIVKQAWKHWRARHLGTVISLDLGMLSAMVLANTKLSMQALHTNAMGRRVAQLNVLQGQACLEARFISSLLVACVETWAIQPREQNDFATLLDWIKHAGREPVALIGQCLPFLRLLDQPSPTWETHWARSEVNMSVAAQLEDLLLLTGCIDASNLRFGDSKSSNTQPIGAFHIYIPSKEQKVIAQQAIASWGAQRNYEIPVA